MVLFENFVTHRKLVMLFDQRVPYGEFWRVVWWKFKFLVILYGVWYHELVCSFVVLNMFGMSSRIWTLKQKFHNMLFRWGVCVLLEIKWTTRIRINCTFIIFSFLTQTRTNADFLHNIKFAFSIWKQNSFPNLGGVLAFMCTDGIALNITKNLDFKNKLFLKRIIVVSVILSQHSIPMNILIYPQFVYSGKFCIFAFYTAGAHPKLN